MTSSCYIVCCQWPNLQWACFDDTSRALKCGILPFQGDFSVGLDLVLVSHSFPVRAMYLSNTPCRTTINFIAPGELELGSITTLDLNLAKVDRPIEGLEWHTMHM